MDVIITSADESIFAESPFLITSFKNRDKNEEKIKETAFVFNAEHLL